MRYAVPIATINVLFLAFFDAFYSSQGYSYGIWYYYIFLNVALVAPSLMLSLNKNLSKWFLTAAGLFMYMNGLATYIYYLTLYSLNHAVWYAYVTEPMIDLGAGYMVTSSSYFLTSEISLYIGVALLLIARRIK